MSDRSFTHFLSESLRAMEREFAVGYAAVCRALGQRDVEIVVNRERCIVAGDGHRVAIRQLGAPIVRASLDRALLAELLAAETTLLDALLADRFGLLGPLDDIVAFDDALGVYFASAPRCPSFPTLLDAFLEGS